MIQRWAPLLGLTQDNSNHLGNVLATITDRKVGVQVSGNPLRVDYFNADVQTISDYYPFGSPMPGRTLAMPACSTTVTTTNSTLVNENFTSTTGSFTVVNGATIAAASGRLRVQRSTAANNWGTARTFTMVSGGQYTFSLNIAIGNCMGGSGDRILVRIKNPSSTVIFTSPAITASGNYSYSFTGDAAGTGTIEVIYSNSGSGTKACSFTMDDALLTTFTESVSTVCGTTKDYRFGFNGMESDNEVYGQGNAYTAEFWEYDPRIGRRWNVDPITNPWQSPYAAFNNNPVYFADPLGLEGKKPKAGKMAKRTPGKEPKPWRRAERFAKSHKGGTVYKWKGEDGKYRGSVDGYGKPTKNGQHSKVFGDPVEANSGAIPVAIGTGAGAQAVGGAAGTILGTAGLFAGAYMIGWELGKHIEDEHVDVFIHTTASILVWMGVERQYLYSPDVISLPKPDAIPSNRNRKDNPNAHIVYTIGGFNTLTGKNEILKYGIADQFYNTYDGAGNRRPTSQLTEELRQAFPEVLIGTTIISRTSNRETALFVEKSAVTIHLATNGQMPRAQTYPMPFTSNEIQKMLTGIQKVLKGNLK